MTENKNDLTKPLKIKEDNNQLSIRPKNLSQFIGQSGLKSNLSTFIKSSIKTC